MPNRAQFGIERRLAIHIGTKAIGRIRVVTEAAGNFQSVAKADGIRQVATNLLTCAGQPHAVEGVTVLEVDVIQGVIGTVAQTMGHAAFCAQYRGVFNFGVGGFHAAGRGPVAGLLVAFPFVVGTRNTGLEINPVVVLRVVTVLSCKSAVFNAEFLQRVRGVGGVFGFVVHHTQLNALALGRCDHALDQVAEVICGFVVVRQLLAIGVFRRLYRAGRQGGVEGKNVAKLFRYVTADAVAPTIGGVGITQVGGKIVAAQHGFRVLGFQQYHTAGGTRTVGVGRCTGNHGDRFVHVHVEPYGITGGIGGTVRGQAAVVRCAFNTNTDVVGAEATNGNFAATVGGFLDHDPGVASQGIFQTGGLALLDVFGGNNGGTFVFTDACIGGRLGFLVVAINAGGFESLQCKCGLGSHGDRHSQQGRLDIHFISL